MLYCVFVCIVLVSAFATLQQHRLRNFVSLLYGAPNYLHTHLRPLNYRCALRPQVELSFAWLLLLIVMEGPKSRDYHEV